MIRSMLNCKLLNGANYEEIFGHDALQTVHLYEKAFIHIQFTKNKHPNVNNDHNQHCTKCRAKLSAVDMAIN